MSRSKPPIPRFYSFSEHYAHLSNHPVFPMQYTQLCQALTKREPDAVPPTFEKWMGAVTRQDHKQPIDQGFTDEFGRITQELFDGLIERPQPAPETPPAELRLDALAAAVVDAQGLSAALAHNQGSPAMAAALARQVEARAQRWSDRNPAGASTPESVIESRAATDKEIG